MGGQGEAIKTGQGIGCSGLSTPWGVTGICTEP